MFKYYSREAELNSKISKEKNIFLPSEELQKSKMTVEKLQKRCNEKAAEIKRLRAAEKRSRIAKCSLEEILCELKNKKWISNEGHAVLNVNSFTL